MEKRRATVSISAPRFWAKKGVTGKSKPRANPMSPVAMMTVRMEDFMKERRVRGDRF